MRRVVAISALVVLLPAIGATGSAGSAPAPGVTEIAAPPLVVRTSDRLRRQAERIASEAPPLAALVAADLGVPPPPSGTIVVMASPQPGDPLGDLASLVPSWAAGVTIPGSATILLRLDRVGGYGQREIRQVLAHELVHLTLAAALPRAGLELPSWFREGIASAVAGEAEILDKWFLWTSRLASSPHPFADLDAALARGEPSHAVAYAGSLAAVNFLRQRHGGGFPARLLSGLRMGSGFDEAFAAAAGATVDHDESLWRKDLRRPRRWIMWIGSAFTLWLGATILIVLAYAVKRRRSRHMLERWRTEEGPDLIDLIEEEASRSEHGEDRQDGPGGETIH